MGLLCKNIFVAFRYKYLSKPSRRRISLGDCLSFVRSYSTQFGFAFIIVVFLTVTVGEGQASDIKPTGYVDLVNAGVDDSYLGKPQLFSDVTVLTGEQQQYMAITYTVEKGDSLTSIAQRYNLHVGSILDANGIAATSSEKIVPGQNLLIPASDSNTNLAWLDDLNRAKELERQKQLAEEQKLAQQKKLAASKNNVSSKASIVGKQKFSSPYPYGYCTSYAAYRSGLPGNLGNAISWYSNARARGYSVGKTPRAGAVMVTTESYWGHVAYVESVSGGSFNVSEMNYAGFGVVSTRTIGSGSGFIIGFIYP